MVRYTVTCEVCGKVVVKCRAEWQAVPRYCSNECKFRGMVGRGKGRKTNVEFDCLHCGKHNEAYQAPNATKARGTPKFCNKKCMDAYQVGSNNPNYKDGRRKMKGGYIGVYSPEHPSANTDGVVPEHILTMERHIGRLLIPAEVVHHKDGNRSNNDISNLVLCANQSEHMSLYHRKGGRYYAKSR